MARIRSIKPEFFVNDELAELPPLTRLFFIGMWTQADRDGRLKDRPRRLKASILPYDDCDVDEHLRLLCDGAFITRYEVDGSRYIQVENFSRHQNPNIKESPSTIPAPCFHRARTEEGVSFREREGEGGDSAYAPDSPTFQTMTGTESVSCLLSTELHVTSPEPYDGTCYGYIVKGMEQRFAAIPSHADLSKLNANIRDGCLPGCSGEHAKLCALQIGAKLAKAGPTFAKSGLWLKCIREDRHEVLR